MRFSNITFFFLSGGEVWVNLTNFVFLVLELFLDFFLCGLSCFIQKKVNHFIGFLHFPSPPPLPFPTSMKSEKSYTKMNPMNTKTQAREELEADVRNNVKNIREEGMKEIYQRRMAKLKGEAERLGVFRDGVYPEFTPQQFVEIAWGDGDTENVCLNGNALMLENIQTKPAYQFETGDNVKYCLVAFDFESKELLWVRFNIQGDTKFSSGRDWFRWTPPRPAQKTGEHRIFFFLFHQKHDQDMAKLKIISKFSKEGREGFCIKKFADKFNFKIVIGLNCCKTRWAPIAEKVQASLKDTVEMDDNKGKEGLLAEPWYDSVVTTTFSNPAHNDGGHNVCTQGLGFIQLFPSLSPILALITRS